MANSMVLTIKDALRKCSAAVTNESCLNVNILKREGNYVQELLEKLMQILINGFYKSESRYLLTESDFAREACIFELKT
jgi:hypothetical protein